MWERKRFCADLPIRLGDDDVRPGCAMISDDASSDPRPRPDAREIAAFAEAIGALLVAALAIAILPFRLLMRTIGLPDGPTSAPPDRDRAANAVTRAIERAARRLPLRIVCLHKGLATHWMLRRRGVATSVHYGVSPANAVLKAHVWVDLGGRTIMGAHDSEAFARVATFPDTGKGVDQSSGG